MKRFGVAFLALILVAGVFSQNCFTLSQSSHPDINFHAASADLGGGVINAGSSTAAMDEQLGLTFGESYSSLAYNVTAVAQADTDNYGPGYLLNGLTTSGYWYQIGISYNWPELSGQYVSGFSVNYNVFNNKGTVVLPPTNSGGLTTTTGGTISQGDNVGLSLTFSGSNVVMRVYDYSSGGTAQETYSSEGATSFVGLSTAGNSNGFFTGLMTEQYHNNAYTGSEAEVQYTSTSVTLTSAILWIDEYNVNTGKLQFGNDSGVLSFSQNPTQYQSYSLSGASEAANANNFITGSVSTVQFTLDYSIVGGGTLESPPTFSYTSFGTPQTATLTTSQQVYTVDLGTSWSVTNPLSGSTTTERWITNQTASGTASTAQTINFVYGHEYSVTVNSNPSTEGSTNPSGSSWYNAGQTYPISATGTNPYFLTSWTATSPLTVVNPTASQTTMLVSGFGTVTANFGAMSLSISSVSGAVTQGTSINIAGTLKGASGSATVSVSGLPSGATLSTSSNSVALTPSGTTFALTIGISYSTTVGSFPITVTSTASGVGSASAQYSLIIRQAVSLTVGYSVQGSGSGYSAPTITYVYNGTTSQSVLGSSKVVYMDQNSQWTVTGTLSGSTTTERWTTNQTTSGSAISATTINFVYYHQYLVQFGYDVLAGGSGYSAPTIGAIQFGSKISPAFGQKTWVDSGSQYSYTNPLAGSIQSQRWDSNSTSGLISSSQSVSLQYYHQFFVSAAFSISNSGLPSTGPLFTYVSFGIDQPTQLTLTPTSYWADSSSNYNVSNTISGSLERWVTNSSTSGTISTGLTLSLVYEHQYYVTTETTASGGSVAPTSEWVNVGNTISISSSATQGWKFEYWTGSGTGSYSGNENVTTIQVEAPFTENATFYVGFTIVSSSGGTVSYTYGNSGSIQVSTQSGIYVPAGTMITLSANPTPFLYKLDSWSGAASGASAKTTITVSSPQTVEAHFGYNLINIGGVAVVVVAAAVVIIFLRRPRVAG